MAAPAPKAPRTAVIVGGGKMGEAMLAGWLNETEGAAAALDADSFIVADPGPERRTYLENRYGVTCVADASEVLEAPDLVVLSVKPQVMASVLESLADLPAYAGGEAGPLFISIAAGLSTERLESMLPDGARLVRVMPNTPLMVGQGASAVTGGANASDEDVALVRDLFGALGASHVVPESAMDAVCAVSGSGPAYVAAMVEAVRDAGARLGLDADLAESLALQTVYGTAALMRDTGQSPEECRIAVCSPGGTTLAALKAMEEAGFAHVFDAGIRAAARRSKELSEC